MLIQVEKGRFAILTVAHVTEIIVATWWYTSYLCLVKISFETNRKKMQKRNIDDDEIILVEDKRDRFFLTQDHNGRKSIIKGGWIGDSQTQYMLIKQYFLQRNGNHVTQNFNSHGTRW